MNGLMTEREWRKKWGAASKARPDWWGAQYVIPRTAPKKLAQDRAFHLFLLLLSGITALLLPVFAPPCGKDAFPEAEAQAVQEEIVPRALSAVRYELPRQLSYQEHTYTQSELARGSLLLLDALHPLPREAPPPNTFRVATYGKGMVPVARLDIKSGRETIDALQELFAALRAQGVSGLAVWEGTVSAAQQRDGQVKRMRALMRGLPPQQARAQTLSELVWPTSAELLQEYTVELRFRGGEGSQPDSRPLESTRQGQTLLQLAWRYGFIRSATEGKGAFCFRYVGRAHAAAMTYLDLSLEAYLEWLHRRGVLTIAVGGQPKYVIQCRPMGGTHIAFSLPEGAETEASLDNLGYAVTACTLP